MTACRVLGTPNDENWPGIHQLPDYKPTFPQWSAQDLTRHVPLLDDAGLDLLKVSHPPFSPLDVRIFIIPWSLSFATFD